jgi:uncharacterized repeat protein (TIGR01451 family)
LRPTVRGLRTLPGVFAVCLFAFLVTPAVAAADTDVSIFSSGDSPDPVAVGGTVTHNFSVSNSCCEDATDTTVTVNLPAELNYVDANSDARCDETAPGSHVVTCALGTIGIFGGDAIAIAATASTPGSDLLTTANVTTAVIDPEPSNDTASEATDVFPPADLVLTMTDSADPVSHGDAYTYSLHVENDGPNTAHGVTITDQLPSELAFDASASDPACTDQGGGLVVCAIGDLNSGASADTVIGVTTVAPNASGASNTATASATDTADPTPADGSATETTVINPITELSLSRSAPTSVNVGKNATFTYTVSNAGPSTANNVVVTEPLPAGAMSRVAAGSSSDCTLTSDTITCAFGSLAAGASDTRTIVLTANPPAAPGFDSTATVASDENADSNPANDSVTGSIVVRRVADLQVSVQANPLVIHAGGHSVITASARNEGPSDVEEVVVSYTLPAGLSHHAAASDPSCSLKAATVTCELGTMTRFQNKSVAIGVSANGTGVVNSPLTNTVSIDGAAVDPDWGDNTRSADLNVTPASDLSLTVAADPGTVTAGQPITYDLDVHNAGPNNGFNVKVSAPLPAGMTFTAAGSSAGCSAVGGSVECTLGNVPNGATVPRTVVLATSAATAATAELTFTVNRILFDPNASNNTASASTTVNRPPAVKPPSTLAPPPDTGGGKKKGKKKKKKKKKSKKRR